MTGGWKRRRLIGAFGILWVIGLAPVISTAGGSRPASLTGSIRVGNFVVPRGTVRVLDGALNLVARDRIEIDGTLEIVGAHNIHLAAGKVFRIGKTGRIMPAPRGAEGSPPQVINAPHLLQLLGSKLVEIDSKFVNAPPGYSLKIATADFGTIRLNSAGLGTADGRASRAPGVDGQSAGSIILGGLFGQNARIELIGSTLRTGRGGNGFSSTKGTEHGTSNPCNDRGGSGDRAFIESRGSDGGRGGTVRLLAKHVVSRYTAVLLGRGGNGGNAHAQAHSGSAGHGGDDVLAWSGDGGAGGGIIIEGDYTAKPDEPIHAGRGGDAGSVTAAAGNGNPNCDGGRTTVLLGRPGELGANKGNGTEPPPAGEKPPYGDITLTKGGNGGRAEDRNHAAGNGGIVQLGIPGRRKNHPLDPPVNFDCCYVGHITVDAYANGGPGFSGCSASPAIDGTDGGTGARLFAGKFQGSLRKFPELPGLTLDVTGSFNGGPGGDGDPVGDGGPPGTTTYKNNFTGSFQPGKKGAPCSGTTENTAPTAFISATFFPQGSAGACEDQAPGNVNYGETCYTIHASDSDGDTLSYGWSHVSPVLDPGCSDFHVLAPPLGPGESVWHHGDADGCNHGVEGPDGHEGVVFANVTDGHFTCVAPYLGTNTGEVPFDAPCYPSGRYALTLVKPYQATASSGNGGTVTSTDGAINCGPTCQLDGHGYAHGAVVKLTATSSGSWTFKGWNGACTGTDPTCLVTMNTDQELTATFGP